MKRAREENPEEENKDSDEIFENEKFYTSKRRIIEHDDLFSFKPYDDRNIINQTGLKTHNIFKMDEEQRKNFLLHHPNPFNYPHKYMEIYSKERNLRCPTGFTNCIDITDTKLIRNDGKTGSKHKIKNITNINCFKTKEIKESNIKLSFYHCEVDDYEESSISVSNNRFPKKHFKFFIDDYENKIRSLSNEYEILLNPKYDFKIREKFEITDEDKEDDEDKMDDDEEINDNYEIDDSDDDNDPIEEYIQDYEHTIEEIENFLNNNGCIPEILNISPIILLKLMDYFYENSGNSVFLDIKLKMELQLLRYYYLKCLNKKTACIDIIERLYDTFHEINDHGIKVLSGFPFFIQRFFNFMPKKYENNYVIAGGIALSYYTYMNYGYLTDFNDIDIFIHGLEGRENEFVKDFYEKISTIAHDNNDDRIIFYKTNGAFFCDKNPFCNILDLNNIKGSYITKKSFAIQVILRSYKSPSEIIHGFDIDSSCICVTPQMRIYGTERFVYSVQNGYNTVNFDRLSPSYSHRLVKYFQRGFAIWIPEIEYFKENLIFNTKYISNIHSGIIIRKILNLMYPRNSLNKLTEPYEEAHDYMVGYTSKNYKLSLFFWDKTNDFNTLEFIKNDPGQQISSTFNKEVLEDPIVWYPSLKKLIDNKVEYLTCNADDIDIDDETIIEVDISSKTEYYSPYIINTSRKLNRRTDVAQIKNAILKDSHKIFGDYLVNGDFVTSAISGFNKFSKNNLFFYIPEENYNIRNIVIFLERFIKMKLTLDYLSNFLIRASKSADTLEYQEIYKLYTRLINGEIDIDTVCDFYCCYINNKYFYKKTQILTLLKQVITNINYNYSNFNYSQNNILRQMLYLKSIINSCYKIKDITFGFVSKIDIIASECSNKTFLLTPLIPELKYAVYECQKYFDSDFTRTRRDVYNIYLKDQWYENEYINNLINNETWENAFPQIGETYTGIEKKFLFIDFFSFGEFCFAIKPSEEILPSLMENLFQSNKDIFKYYEFPFEHNSFYYREKYYTENGMNQTFSLCSKDKEKLKIIPYPVWQNYIVDPNLVIPEVKYHTVKMISANR